MKLKEFAKNIRLLLKDFPETADYEVVTSKDDEGNGFSPVYYAPSIGYYEDMEFDQDSSPNAVCVN